MEALGDKVVAEATAVAEAMAVPADKAVVEAGWIGGHGPTEEMASRDKAKSPKQGGNHGKPLFPPPLLLLFIVIIIVIVAIIIIVIIVCTIAVIICYTNSSLS